jgi:hypothetical protein
VCSRSGDDRKEISFGRYATCAKPGKTPTKHFFLCISISALSFGRVRLILVSLILMMHPTRKTYDGFSHV